MKILVTGGRGFIGSNFVRHVLETTEYIRVINLDGFVKSPIFISFRAKRKILKR